MTLRAALPCLLALALAGPATAQTMLSIPLPDDAQVISARYGCTDGEVIGVQYVNAGVNSLALLTRGTEMRVFVSAISGSGARYVGAQYEWWSKGDEASFSNLMDDSEARTCTRIEDGQAG